MERVLELYEYAKKGEEGEHYLTGEGRPERPARTASLNRTEPPDRTGQSLVIAIRVMHLHAPNVFCTKFSMENIY